MSLLVEMGPCPGTTTVSSLITFNTSSQKRIIPSMDPPLSASTKGGPDILKTSPMCKTFESLR